MTDKTKKIMKYSGMGAVAVGSGLMYLAGSSESSVTAIVAGIFIIASIIFNIIKGA